LSDLSSIRGEAAAAKAQHDEEHGRSNASPASIKPQSVHWLPPRIESCD
jgi:hypothetical protein